MPGSKDNRAGNGRLRLRAFQVLLAVLLLVIWYVLTSPTLLPPIYFTEANQAAFFFGEPVKVFARLWQWFVSGEIYEHLWVTLVETLLAFLIGTVSGVAIGLWLALSPTASAVLDPYIKAVNAMPRVILAPIFFVWFGLGIGSKVALGVTLVFFIVFFNVYQGVREVSPVVLANARLRRRGRRRIPRLREGSRLPHPPGRGVFRHEYRGRRHPALVDIRARARLGGRCRGKTTDGLAAALKRDRTRMMEALLRRKMD